MEDTCIPLLAVALLVAALVLWRYGSCVWLARLSAHESNDDVPFTATCVMVEPSREEIAAAAYARYERRGRRHGHDKEDWLAAERNLRTIALGRMQTELSQESNKRNKP